MKSINKYYLLLSIFLLCGCVTKKAFEKYEKIEFYSKDEDFYITNNTANRILEFALPSIGLFGDTIIVYGRGKAKQKRDCIVVETEKFENSTGKTESYFKKKPIAPGDWSRILFSREEHLDFSQISLAFSINGKNTYGTINDSAAFILHPDYFPSDSIITIGCSGCQSLIIDELEDSGYEYHVFLKTGGVQFESTRTIKIFYQGSINNDSIQCYIDEDYNVNLHRHP